MSSQKPKKRKASTSGTNHSHDEDTSKPSAIYKPTKGRQHTLSIALPGSIIANAPTHDTKTALAGQIARACAVFCVDEVVIFDDGQAQIRPPEQDGYTAFADPNFFLYHILSYLETPPHLRKRLFPMHPDLRTAGSLPSVDMPHHLRSDEKCPFREGIVINNSTNSNRGSHCIVDCGLSRHVSIPVDLDSDTRVTLSFVPPTRDVKDPREATPVSPDTPREEAGYYWGYSVRQASSLSNIFTECPYDGGYDISVGTSERGKAFASLLDQNSDSWVEPTWSHLLIVFGGIAGLEAALAADRDLQSAGVRDANALFDRWINIVPGQGSRTIRTEEAIWVALTALHPLVEERNNA